MPPIRCPLTAPSSCQVVFAAWKKRKPECSKTDANETEEGDIAASVQPTGLSIVAMLDGSVRAVSVTLLPMGSDLRSPAGSSISSIDGRAGDDQQRSVHLHASWHVQWPVGPDAPVPILSSPLVSGFTAGCSGSGHCISRAHDPMMLFPEAANPRDCSTSPDNDLVLVAHVNGVVVARALDSGQEVCMHGECY